VDAEPPTEPMVAMVPTMVGKVEQDQRVAESFGRTGENRTGRPNGTELEFGWWAWWGQGGRKLSATVGAGAHDGTLLPVRLLGLGGDTQRLQETQSRQPNFQTAVIQII